MVGIRGAPEFGRDLTRVLASPREELLIAFTHSSTAEGWHLVVNRCRLAADDEVTRDASGLHWSGDLTSQLYSQARTSDSGLLLLHAHAGAAQIPSPSPTDRHTADEILTHFATLLPGRPHAYVVVNRTHLSGWVQLSDQRQHVDELTVVDTPMATWRSRSSEPSTVHRRDDRQQRALGREGIAALRQTTVGIVGLGGAGSQVAEMLAHAGIGGLVLVDHDRLEEPNLSRTHGAWPELIGELKVDSARQLIERISPDTSVTVVAEPFPTPNTLNALHPCAVVISCVDNVQTRSEVNRFVLRHALPLLDIGTTITPEPFRVDGHLTLAMPGSQCLRCLGHVSDVMLEQTRARARQGRYGLDEQRPQVVSFNGLLASAAVTEVLKLLTGFGGSQPGSREWHYDPVHAELRRVNVSIERCSECAWFGLKGDSK